MKLSLCHCFALVRTKVKARCVLETSLLSNSYSSGSNVWLQCMLINNMNRLFHCHFEYRSASSRHKVSISKGRSSEGLQQSEVNF